MARKIGRVRIVEGREFYERVLQIMIPVALQSAINMGVNMLDTMMLGSFGEIQLSASSLANQFYNIFYIANLGIIGGSSVLASQYWGAGEKENARTTFNMAIRLSILFSLIFALITWFFPGGIMRLYSTEPEVIEQGIRYLRITTFVYLIHGTSLVAAQLMRSVGVVRLGLAVSIVSFVVNIGANYTFIFGKFGAPRMEIAGAALGTLIALFGAIQSVMTKGVLRGGGDTKFLMKADILFLWIVSVPLGALVGLVLHGPAWLTIICLRIDYIIKSIWCIGRLLSGKWIHRFE